MDWQHFSWAQTSRSEPTAVLKPSGLGQAAKRWTGCKAAPLEAIVSGHKYQIGQLVNYLTRERASGVYQITQLLPPEGGTFQYRIKKH